MVDLHTLHTLCTPEGFLDTRALRPAWSREPCWRANLHGRWPRKKRWDYWCVSTPACLFAITLADIDYLGLAVVSHLDLATGRWTERAVPVPLAMRRFFPAFPESVRGGDLRFRALGLAIAITEEGNTTRLRAEARGLRADVVVDRAGDSLSVVVPWSASHFQLTTKAFALPARGTVTCASTTYVMDGGFACLDFGRGVWPYRTAWNWASAAGRQGERTIGLNLGGQWTRGTGATENGLLVDGRLVKIDDEVDFDFERGHPSRSWRIRGPGVELVFTPQSSRALGANLGMVASRLEWAYGTFSGRIAGETLRDLPGWAEEHRARW